MTKRTDTVDQKPQAAKKTAPKKAAAKKPEQSVIQPNTTFTLTITVADQAAARQKAIAKAQKVMKADGFRQGMVPVKLVEQRLGEASIAEMILEETLSPAYTAAVQDKKLEPLTEPDVKPVSMKPGEDWTFEVSIALLPEVATGSVKKLITDLQKKNDLWTQDQKDTPEAKLRQDRVQAVLTTILEALSIPVPELLLRRETERQLHELGHQLEHLGMNLEEYIKKIGRSEAELQQDYAARALGTLQVEIFLANYIRQEKLTLEAAEVEAVVQARMANLPQEQKTISRREVEYIQATLLKQKAIDSLLTTE